MHAATFLFNGHSVDNPDLLQDRGLHYGDGVFRTLAVHAGEALDLAGQLAHLARDASRLGIAVPVEVEQETRNQAAGCKNAVLKIILTRGSSGRGYAFDPAITANRLILTAAVPAGLGRRQQGMRLQLCQYRLGHQPRLAGIKHLNRLDQVLARREWQSGRYDEGLLQDQSGLLISGVQSNLFVVINGELHTPDLRQCGVAGRMRERILELARQKGMRCRVQDIGIENLLQAQEIFLTNSLLGIGPVLQLQDQHWPRGPLTTELQRLLAHPPLS